MSSDRLTGLDASFLHLEDASSHMHVAGVMIFEGDPPPYDDLLEAIDHRLGLVPRYRQRLALVPLGQGRPKWVDDPHLNLHYHVRSAALPSPGSEEQLKDLAGRVFSQQLDRDKPLWEVWLVEGLEDDRWALISKVHHCMVDGVAGTDLMQMIFDTDPDADHSQPPADWTPNPPSTGSLVLGSLHDTVTRPLRQLVAAAEFGTIAAAPRGLMRAGSALRAGLPALVRQAATPAARSLNGPIGPHRRWAWAETTLEELKRIRSGLGGTVNDVVLTAITHGFRELLEHRGALTDGLVVRSMVPVSVRRTDEQGALNNQVTAVFVDLPVAEPDPRLRLASLRRQMDEHKRLLSTVDARTIIGMGDFVAPTLLALGTRAGARAGQPWAQTVTTNVPGPPVPLYVLGRRMRSLYPYVPIAAGTRVSIGIYSYQRAMTFGINADFDAFPDIEVLADGICRGIAELDDVAGADQSGKRGAGDRRDGKASRRVTGGPKAGRSGAGSRRRTSTRGPDGAGPESE